MSDRDKATTMTRTAIDIVDSHHERQPNAYAIQHEVLAKVRHLNLPNMEERVAVLVRNLLSERKVQ
jgi:hypothetical protein